MSIERIFIRPPGGNLTVERQSVRVVAGAGVEGDRYFHARDEPGQNITFIEAEEIEAFAREHRWPVDLSATGRNVVTRGVRLNELVGREFVVGSVRFRGVELCEPCLALGEALATPTLSPARVVERWVHRGGLRADALTSGELHVGLGFRRGGAMSVIRNPDHVTIAVANAAAAIGFFELLGFRKQHVAMIDGGPPARYMGMPSMKAQHITLVLEGAEPHFEIQLLEFDPRPPDDPGEHPTNMRRRGYNHLAFRVDDIEAAASHLTANGVKMLSDEMDYISRRLRLFEGPEGITLELVQWVDTSS